MEAKQKIILLRHIVTARGAAEISVQGVSMEPLLYAGDTIRVTAGAYAPGDILVFPYKYGELLVHRYVGNIGDRILLKGDNAFRLEDIAPTDVIGKAEAIICGDAAYPIPPMPREITDLSLQAGRLFRKHKYDAAATAAEPPYQQFREAVTACAAFREGILPG